MGRATWKGLGRSCAFMTRFEAHVNASGPAEKLRGGERAALVEDARRLATARARCRLVVAELRRAAGRRQIALRDTADRRVVLRLRRDVEQH